MSIYVIGDFGLDVYHVGTPRGLSAEVPIPVLTLNEIHTLPAMAGNVVANLHALGAEVVPLQPQKMTRPGAQCPVKNRLMSTGGQQIARWDENDSCPAYSRGELAALRAADAIVVADYGKGALNQELVQVLCEFEGPLFVDTKQDPTAWVGCKNAILFPNSAEYKQFEEKYGWIERVVLKMGPQGMAYLEYGKALLSKPSYALGVQCVNGAGDTALAAFAVATLHGLPLPQCLEFASAAAANVVEQDFLTRVTTLEDTVGRLQLMEEEGEDDDEQDSPGGDTAELGLGNRADTPHGELSLPSYRPRVSAPSASENPGDDEPSPIARKAAEADTVTDTTIANFLRHWRLGDGSVN